MAQNGMSTGQQETSHHKSIMNGYSDPSSNSYKHLYYHFFIYSDLCTSPAMYTNKLIFNQQYVFLFLWQNNANQNIQGGIYIEYILFFF